MPHQGTSMSACGRKGSTRWSSPHQTGKRGQTASCLPSGSGVLVGTCPQCQAPVVWAGPIEVKAHVQTDNYAAEVLALKFQLCGQVQCIQG